MFYNAKDGLLESKMPSFVKCLTVSLSAGGRQTRPESCVTASFHAAYGLGEGRA